MLIFFESAGRLAIACFIVCVVLADSAFARSKNRSPIYQDSPQILQLNEVLKSNGVDSAESLAVQIYQQSTNSSALQASDSSTIIDPALVNQTVEFNRTKTAFDIGATFYRHAELDLAKEWAITATNGGTLAEQYVRRATILLGDIASAMDKDSEAIADFTSVIELQGQYPEQPMAYAGLLEVLLLEQDDDAVAQWVQHGSLVFAGSNLELDFLKQLGAVLKRHNQPLWRSIDQRIVALSASSSGNKLSALRRLGSNALKFGRWAEAETNYAAICALGLGSAQDTVDSYLSLAEAQAQQSKNFAPTLQALRSNAVVFAQASDREYAAYRIAKFYQEQGRLDAATSSYQTLVSSSSTSTWAAASLHQLAMLKEKQGDLKSALKLYLQYPDQYSTNKRLAMQAYGNALNVAQALQATNIADQIVAIVTNRTANSQDYNVHLNLALYFRKRGQSQIANGYLQNGLSLAQSALNLATTGQDRCLIHFRVLRRLFDFAQYQKVVDYFTAHAADIADPQLISDEYQLQCRGFKALALMYTGNRQQALDELGELLDESQADRTLGPSFAGLLGFHYNTPADKATATEFFEWAARKYPDHPWANFGRLELAIDRYNAGDFAAAQKLAEQVTNAVRSNSRMSWVREMYWGAIYLRGCCLEAQGIDGKPLKQTAMAQVPSLPIQQRLNPPVKQ